MLRILIQHTQPIVIIAVTNHALDHLLSGVLDAGITRKIVRLGSHSADARISQYSIEKTRLRNFEEYLLKQVQQELVSLVKNFVERRVLSSDIMAYIEMQYPEHHEHVCSPPPWINTLISILGKSDETGGRKMAGKRDSKMPSDDTTYGRWLCGEDLDYLNTRPNLLVVKPTADGTSNIASEILNRFNASINASVKNAAFDDSDSGSDDMESDKELEMDSDSESEADWQRVGFSEVEEVDPLTFFNAHAMNSIPEIPITNRELETLLAQSSMWTLSKKERLKLDNYWREQTYQGILQGQLEEFERLRRKHKVHQGLVNQRKDEVSCVSI